MQSPYLIGYTRNGKVELGWFFDTLVAAHRWAKWFVRDFESIVVYSADGQVVETVRPSRPQHRTPVLVASLVSSRVPVRVGSASRERDQCASARDRMGKHA